MRLEDLEGIFEALVLDKLLDPLHDAEGPRRHRLRAGVAIKKKRKQDQRNSNLMPHRHSGITIWNATRV